MMLCRDCGLMATDNTTIGDQEEAHAFLYEQETHNPLLAKAMIAVSRAKLRQAKPAIRGRRLLDVGCAFGLSVRAGLDEGFEVVGLDSSESARDHVTHVYGIVAVRDLCELEHTQSSGFDVIHMSHVLEHIPLPVEYLRRLRGHLNHGGMLVISVPNPYSLAATLAAESWAGWFPEAHYYHYSTKSLRLMLARAGYGIVSLTTQPRVGTMWIIKRLKVMDQGLFDHVRAPHTRTLDVAVQSCFRLPGYDMCAEI